MNNRITQRRIYDPVYFGVTSRYVFKGGEWQLSQTTADTPHKNTNIKLETLVPPVVITLQDRERVQSLLNVLHCALNAQESDNYVDGVDKDTAIEIQEYLEKVLDEHK